MTVLKTATNQFTHQITANSKSVNTSVPVSTLISRSKLAVSHQLVYHSLSSLIEL